MLLYTMSLSSLYNSTKKDKTPPKEKVIYSTSIVDLKSDIVRLQSYLDEIKTNTDTLNDSIKKLEALKMDEFCKKHDNMKTNYNSFVDSYNVFTSETNFVITEMANRLNEVEGRLGI
jgi:hypothetical protein